MIALVEEAQRPRTPSEIAPNILPAGMTIIVLSGAGGPLLRQRNGEGAEAERKTRRRGGFGHARCRRRRAQHRQIGEALPDLGGIG
ncbi:MAG: hypothetical protein FJX56_01935 [Alphaproteobacteria bacterium]|nr:hypothetical protein [Alphaproteobacteria bacterium]